MSFREKHSPHLTLSLQAPSKRDGCHFYTVCCKSTGSRGITHAQTITSCSLAPQREMYQKRSDVRHWSILCCASSLATLCDRIWQHNVGPHSLTEHWAPIIHHIQVWGCRALLKVMGVDFKGAIRLAVRFFIHSFCCLHLFRVIGGWSLSIAYTPWATAANHSWHLTSMGISAKSRSIEM